jgi:hypothetical protein
VFFGTNVGSRVGEATLGVGVLFTVEVHPEVKITATNSIPTTIIVDRCFRVMQPTSQYDVALSDISSYITTQPKHNILTKGAKILMFGHPTTSELRYSLPYLGDPGRKIGRYGA